MDHNVKFKVPKRELGSSSITFDVLGDGFKVGTLSVSKGSIKWQPVGKWKSKPHTLNWEQFNRLMEGHVQR